MTAAHGLQFGGRDLMGKSHDETLESRRHDGCVVFCCCLEVKFWSLYDSFDGCSSLKYSLLRSASNISHFFVK